MIIEMTVSSGQLNALCQLFFIMHLDASVLSCKHGRIRCVSLGNMEYEYGNYSI